jgi:hypothetical protein
MSMAEPPTIPVKAPMMRPFQAFFMSFLFSFVRPGLECPPYFRTCR